MSQYQINVSNYLLDNNMSIFIISQTLIDKFISLSQAKKNHLFFYPNSKSEYFQ